MFEARKDYGVRVVVAFGNNRVGRVLFPPGLLRDALVKRGFVERIAPPIVAVVKPEPDDGNDGIPEELRRRRK